MTLLLRQFFLFKWAKTKTQDEVESPSSRWGTQQMVQQLYAGTRLHRASFRYWSYNSWLLGVPQQGSSRLLDDSWGGSKCIFRYKDLDHHISIHGDEDLEYPVKLSNRWRLGIPNEAKQPLDGELFVQTQTREVFDIDAYSLGNTISLQQEKIIYFQLFILLKIENNMHDGKYY